MTAFLLFAQTDSILPFFSWFLSRSFSARTCQRS